MLLRKFAGLVVSSALVISMVGCNGAGTEGPVDIGTPATPGSEEMTETEDGTDTDTDWGLDDDTTTGN